MGWYDTIKPTSPNINTFSDLPSDCDDWTCSMWELYHARNKAISGQLKANEWLILDCSRVGSFSELGWCKYDCDFIDYLHKEGIPYSTILSNIYCSVTDVSEVIKDTTESVSKVNVLLIASIVGIAIFFKDEIKNQLKK